MTTEERGGVMDARKKAWETRRKKYGSSGHKGSYRCGTWRYDAKEQARVRNMEDALIELYESAILSEGQVSKMTGLDRITVRIRADDMRNKK